MNFRMSLLAAACLLLTAAPASAENPILVQPNQFDTLTIRHSPPTDNSPQTKAELATLQQIQAKRTPAQFHRAAADGKDKSVFLFRDALGDGFTAARLPVTAAFFAKVGTTKPSTSTAPKTIGAVPGRSRWMRLFVRAGGARVSAIQAVMRPAVTSWGSCWAT
jgi:hypothetical protein